MSLILFLFLRVHLKFTLYELQAGAIQQNPFDYKIAVFGSLKQRIT